MSDSKDDKSDTKAENHGHTEKISSLAHSSTYISSDFYLDTIQLDTVQIDKRL